MTQAEQLAAFVVRASYGDLSEAGRRQLKIRVLDSLGCGIGALQAGPIHRIRELVQDLGGVECCTLIGGGRTAPDRAAFYNGALVRYLDFNDSYLAKGETCHPSDNLGAVLAASEYVNRSGRDFLTALAVAYQVLCRLCDVAPVRAKGFDHTTLGEFKAFMLAQSQPYPEMIQMVRGLKARYGLKVAVISNEGRELTVHRIRRFELGTFVDFFIASCFVHCRKPDPDIYRIALDIAQVAPAQVAYIEDRVMFVEVSRGLGFQSIHHTGYESTRAHLAALGLSLEASPERASPVAGFGQSKRSR